MFVLLPHCPVQSVSIFHSSFLFSPAVFHWFTGCLFIYLSGIASLVFKYVPPHIHTHTLTHTYRYSQFELTAGGTNCLSVGTLLLLFIFIFSPLLSSAVFTLHLSWTLPSFCPFFFSSPPSDLFSPCTFSPFCLFHHGCPSTTWPAEDTHTHHRLGWYITAKSMWFIFNERLWFNWTLLSLDCSCNSTFSSSDF